MTALNQAQIPLRFAVLTLSISHFEVPLFQLCSQDNRIVFKVFYIQPVKTGRFDSDYGQKIDWGYKLLEGFDSIQVNDPQELDQAARKWGADVILLYGYGWPGAPQIILKNWWNRQAQIHRGTLNYYLDPRRPIKGRLMRPLGRMLLRLFHAHHYGGEYSKQVLLKAGAKEAALFFVPYSVDTPHFLAATEHKGQQEMAISLRQSNGWTKNDHVILFIAQHNWFKGPDIAIRVFQKTAKLDPTARFLVVGSGSMTANIKKYAQQHIDPHKIHFVGFVPSAKTVAYYLASDIVICTSRYETWARMVNEAMLCRCPCLVSKIVPAAGGLIVDGKNGYVLERPDVGQFVSVIQQHFSLPKQQRQSMGEAARKKAQEFAYELSMDNVVAAVRFALTESKKSRKILK